MNTYRDNLCEKKKKAGKLPFNKFSSPFLDFVPWWSGVLKVPRLAVPVWCPAAPTLPLLPTAVCPQTLTPSWCISAGTSTIFVTVASWRICSRGWRAVAPFELLVNEAPPHPAQRRGSEGAEGLFLFCFVLFLSSEHLTIREKGVVMGWGRLLGQYEAQIPLAGMW